MHALAIQIRALALFSNKHFIAQRIIDHASDQRAIGIGGQARRPVLQPHRDAKGRKAMRKICCAIQRVHVPAVFAFQL